jgi:hypothetical protein
MNEDVAVWERAEVRMLAMGVRDADDSDRHFTGIARLSSCSKLARFSSKKQQWFFV